MLRHKVSVRASWPAGAGGFGALLQGFKLLMGLEEEGDCDKLGNWKFSMIGYIDTH